MHPRFAWLAVCLAGGLQVLGQAALAGDARIPTDATSYPKGVSKQPAAVAQCLACHGPVGISQNPDWPNLAGQRSAYLAQQLKDFQTGVRQHPMMAPVVAILKEPDIQAVSKYFAAQTGVAIAPQSVVPAVSQACVACHATSNEGQDPAWPHLTGQKAPYLAAQLRAFRSGARKNALMEPMAKGLSDQDIDTLAKYFSGQ